MYSSVWPEAALKAPKNWKATLSGVLNVGFTVI